MGTIRRYADGFRVSIYSPRDPETGKHRRPSKYVKAPNTRAGRKKAEAALAQLILDHEHQPIAPKAQLGTVADLFDRWLASQAHRLSPKTLAEYRRAARLKILPHIGDMRLTDVRVSDLDRLYVTLLVSGGEEGQPLAPNSVRRVHIAISGAFAAAVKWGELEKNPARFASPPSPRSSPIEPPSIEQITATLAHLDQADGPLWRPALFRLAATTGARRSQLLGVRSADIDLESGTLRFTRSVTRTAGQTIVRERTKSGKSYAVSIDEGTIAAIKAQQADQRSAARAAGVTMNPNPFLFDDRKSLTGSAPMSPNAVKSWWSRLPNDVPSMAGVRLHDLRHFVATQLLAQGVDIVTVSTRLGHNDPSVTLRIYAHWIAARDRSASDLMSTLLA